MKLRLAIALAALALSCGKKDDGGNGGNAGKTTEGGGGGLVTLDASGSTFQKAFEEVAIEAYTKQHPNVKINYGAGGSGKGRQDLADMVVDFAGSDAPYKDADKAKLKGGDVLYFPILLGAVSVSYHLDGVAKLQLSPETVAKIFQRDIKKWNDPAIAADNPGVTLPATDITVAHRADGSGTTDIFTHFLDGGSAGAWKLKAGGTVEWPADTQAGNGNSGVAQIVTATNGAIGYVDLSDAKAAKLSYAAIKNAAGKYITPDAASVSAAGDGIAVKDDLTFSAVNSKGDAAYPITGQTWVIVYAKPADKQKAAAIKAYLAFLLGDGQKLAPDVDFAPLPKALQDKAIAQLGKIQT
ncbi:MAG TPA: phosphate ABC transporter substrate-binding protein PstS [Kofleriaceae bacterium]|jgi:phosphate transport system substrate-binding protein